ncbi:MAG: GGDEF domain-containing protein [Gammaproteobacteria bacterium]|nr:MAG: GGDEF domain-containing protein [Gammaproteobacteria bacterium]
MKKIVKIISWSLLIAFAYTNLATAQSQGNTKSSKTEQKPKKTKDLRIRQAVIDALKASKSGSRTAAGKILQLSLLIPKSSGYVAVSSNTNLNKAEQYILLLAKAYLSKQKAELKKVIEYLTAAEKFKKKIPRAQLSQPMFMQLEWLMAESYATLGDFDQAYVHKHRYLRKYIRNNYNQKDALVEQLSKKFEMKKKLKENKLLADQNVREQEKIAKIDKLQQQQKLYTIILVVVAVVFLLIMLREYRVRRQLVRLGRTDALTGLVNRKTLFYLGERLFKKSLEQQLPLAVIYFDADYFKKINDTFGHQVGDEILKQFARIGNEVIRSRDVFARLGGEEFVLILPDENLVKAKAVAEHLRVKIAKHDFSLQGINSRVTASFGVVSTEKTVENFDQLLHDADIAMYQAKAQGRNNVVCFIEKLECKQKSHVRSSS